MQGKAHTLLETNSLLPVTLSIEHPAESGNCTVHLADAKDPSSYTILVPLDRPSTDSGLFACGREHSEQETVLFQLPFTWVCEECVLEVMWQTFQANFYDCADILVEVSSMVSCEGLCQNNGECSPEGFCLCTKGYSGQFCEHSAEEASEGGGHVLVFFLVVLAVVMLASLIGYGVHSYFKRPRKVPNVDPDQLAGGNARQGVGAGGPGAPGGPGGAGIAPQPYGLELPSRSRTNSDT